MRLSRIGLLASAMLLFATSVYADPLGDIQAQLDALRKQDTYKVNTGSLSIESWLLTSTAIEATAVASKFPIGIIPSAAVTADVDDGALINSFKELVSVADDAQDLRDKLAANNPGDAGKAKIARLDKLLGQYGKFYDRVTTGDANGNVPLVTAAKLDELLGTNAHILRVNTEAAGGTLVKRTNLFTALGAQSAFITGGLVS